jgi:hypothetical protein
MNAVESSYEGAIARMRRLGFESQADATIATPPARSSKSSDAARMRDLEELAALACEENERLERELAELRDENAELKRRMSTMQPRSSSAIAMLTQAAPAMQPASAEPPAPTSFADAAGDSTRRARTPFRWDAPADLATNGASESFDVLPKKGSAWKLVLIGAAGLAGIVLLVLHPWSVAPAVVVTPPPPAPVAVAPAPTPVPTPPVVVKPVVAAPLIAPAPTIPTVPTVSSVGAAPSHHHAKAKRQKHAAKKKHGKHKLAKADWNAKGDPLGGLTF